MDTFFLPVHRMETERVKDMVTISKTVGVENLYNERKVLYESFSQITVTNDKKYLDTVKEIIEKCEY